MNTLERNEVRASPSHRRGLGGMLAALIAFVMVSTSCIGFFASAGDYYPEVWTDRDEYAPGMVVSIYGEGFARHVDVSIELDHPDFEATKTFTAQPDYYGKFMCDDYVAEYVNSEINVVVTVTQVLSDQVLVATTEFADPAVFIEGYTLEPQMRWTAGDIKGYNEGDSVPFSVVVDRSSLADTITIRIGVDMLDVNSPDEPAWAIDYLTQYWDGDGTPEVPNFPLNIWPAMDEPFYVDAENASILNQGWVEDALDESTMQWISVWEFELDFTEGAERAIVYFGAHLALTVLDPDTLEPTTLGASFYPGSAAHVRLVSVEPPLGDEGNRDVPIMLSGCLMPPDMNIAKSCDPDSVALGDEITFTISWMNIGQDMADEVVIADDLPSVLDLDTSSFLFWTSEDATPEYPSDMLLVDEAMDSFELDIDTWPGTGAESADDPLIGYLQFTADVISDAFGMYENRAIMTYSDDHGGFFPTEEAFCLFVILAEPEILIEKTGPAYAHVGDVVTYEYTVTNIGTIDLVDVDVVDDMAGVVASDLSLAMGESVPLTADYAVSDLLDPVVNIVTATGEDSYGRITECTDTWSMDVLNPEIVIEKVAAEEYAEVGDTIHYTITISNPSDADLFDLTVTDPLLGISWTYDELLAGSSIEESVSFVVPAGMDPVENTVLVTAEDVTGLDVQDSDGSEVDVVHLDLEVMKVGSLTVAAPGDVIEYWIYVTNPSLDTALDIEVWDLMFDDEAPIYEGSLAAGATVDLGPYYFTVPDDTETVYNMVEVDAWGPVGYVSDCDSWTVDVIHPGISIDKYADVEYAAAGDTIEYYIEVSNPSNDATMYVEVYDPMLSATVLWTGVLGPEESYTIGPLEYLVPEGVELVENTATVEADDGLGHEEEDDDSFVVDVIHPGISIDKYADVEYAAEGGTIEYYIEVSNPSPDVVMYVEVYDPMLSSEMLWSGYLDPLASYTIGPLEYTVPDGMELVENTAYATAEDTYGHDEYAEDSVTVEILYPAIEVTKTGPEFASVGETITYDVYVTNTGNTPLYDVSVEDSLEGTLAVGETLDVGEVLHYTYTYVVPEGTGTLDNIVDVSGCDGTGSTTTSVYDSASWIVSKYGEISGFKTADLNLDAYWEEGEPGLANWVITLFGDLDDGSTVSRTTITGTDGSYSFTMLEPGVYTVSEVMQDGWEAVTVDSYTVEVGSGSILAMSFGNIPYGSISGHKWMDVDLDGIWDEGEDPIAGWTIYIEGQDASGGYVDTSALTDADGYYCFSDLLPGVYYVSEELRDGWIASTPTQVEIDVSALEPFEVTSVDFGNVMYGQITGYKWMDEWMNGIWDGIEDPIEGWTIELTGELADETPFGPIYTLTDENGFYHFDGLLPGTYVVREVVPDGWLAITAEQYEVTIDMGDIVFCAKFGNVEYGMIDGWKFLDWDMDGFFDGIEDGLEGWEITLEGWLNDAIPPYSYEGTYVGPFTTYTDKDGYWCFDNLLPGLYKITEEARDGWLNTTPREVYVLLGSGSYVFDVKFGNVPYTCFDGYKFEDLNGDGQWQDNEPGLPGWTIVIDGVQNDGVPVHIELVTDEAGYWATCFQMLPGTYLISEVAQDGWVAMTPDEYLFAMPMSDESWMVYTFLFGNFEGVDIEVFKYEDVNSDGRYEEGVDVPVEGWYFMLVDVTGAVVDSGFTDADGMLVFHVCMAGEWTVVEETREHVTPVNPADGELPVETYSGAEPETLMFGNFWDVLIEVFKYEDVNSNGVYDQGIDLPLEGWEFTVTGPCFAEPLVVLTDADGYAAFWVTAAGTYTVDEEDRLGWTHITPADGDLEATVASGDLSVMLEFGNFEDVTILVFKFDDRHADGQYCPDDGDVPIEGWAFELYVLVDDVWVLVASGVTGADGTLEFVLTVAGEYKVVETVELGWFVVMPVGGEYLFEVGSGDGLLEFVFANFKLGKIFGYKWNDLDGDGIWDEGEPGLEGWTIWAECGYWVGEVEYYLLAFDITDASGYYEMASLPPGTYTVWEEAPEGEDDWIPTSPAMVYVDIIGHTEARVDFLNFELGCIEGYKYEDYDGDGMLDPEDLAIEGWYVYLYLDGKLFATALTDASGHYSFCGLGPGEYTVLEEDRTGWIPTNEPSELVVMTSGALVSVHDFLNFELGKITGWKFEDVNSNGVWDDGEPAIEGWKVTMIRDADEYELVEYTDEDGMFVFSGLEADYYMLWEELVEGWTPTTTSWMLVDIFSGSVIELDPFGNFQNVPVELFKYEDVDGNGVFNTGDVALEGWEFTVTGPCFATPLVVTTDVDGMAAFVITAAGTYTVTETVPDGWVPVEPETGSIEVTVCSGDRLNTLLFGNFMLGEITGLKFYDSNMNGVQDEGESGLANWVIWVEGTLLSGETVLYTRITDSSGYYAVTGLMAGAYVVSERLEYAPAGWEPTTPTSVEIDVASGTVMSVSFGNVVLGIIEGYKFYDKDRDGVQDDGEPGLAGWTIILEGTTDEGLAVYETRVTDADGYYLFDEVQPGVYTVTETLLDTWTATTPVPVTVDVSGTLEYFEQQVDIGNIRFAKVFGYKFMDTIPAVFPYWPNGVFDEDEVGLANWEITLQGWTESGEWVDLVRYTSDGDDLGYYAFEELLPGTYWINETMLWGWYASTPISNMVMIYPYPSGMVVYSIDFGNVLPLPDPELPFFLEKGWNLWSMPFVVDGLTASGLLQAIGPSGSMVTMLDEAEGRYYTYMAGTNMSDFAIEASEGYFVFVTADTSFTLTGYFPEVSSTSLQGGWNFIGYSSLEPEMASELLVRAGGLMLTCYDEESGRYVSYMSGESAEYDFLVTPGKAYYIWVSGPCDLVFK